ncbi:MAG: DAK2 domain-containing protein [Lachnospiraceae bacterium]|nr:DAK2 domain-containing protein [Lachnospiraceae bacterium]
MNTNTINADLCAKMFLAGARNLESNKEWINELNVFPVPDGDTGTNMTLTIMSAVREVSALDSLTMESLSKAVSSGSLRGARGNSGVILSQLLRGFTKVIRTEEEITPVILTAAFQKAVETAYKAVMKPKEGTILTVARGGAERAAELIEENPDIEMEILMSEILARTEEVLNETPELLPVLKEAGVVDSGGQGLVQVLKGAFDAFRGIVPPAAEEANPDDRTQTRGESLNHEQDISFGNTMEQGQSAGSTASGQSEVESAFLYDTAFQVIPAKEYTPDADLAFRTYLEAIGDGVSLAFEAGRVRVHVHTNDPGRVLQKALKLGALMQIRIENTQMEQLSSSSVSDCASDNNEGSQTGQEKTEEGANPFAIPEMSKRVDLKETGFISVSIGDGIADIFRDLGVDCLIEGGQTMNPSTEDMLNAIDQVNAKNIFILPNNKNIILAANQAKSLTRDKNIFVIPTKTVPQGITAVINYVPEKSPEENAMVMELEIENVRTGQVTYAVRDTHIENKVISAGDIMGVGDHSILAVGKDTTLVAEETIAEMMTDEAELISIYYGEDMKKEEADVLLDHIAERYPDCDVELNYGGQPIYYYIISVE